MGGKSEGNVDRGGTYALFLDMDEELVARVGTLGILRFGPGVYVYAGSARRGLEARLARHARRRKVVHWHVDTLTTGPGCLVVGAMTFGPGGPSECGIVEILLGIEGITLGHPSFGSTDHRCAGHLVFIGQRPELVERAVDALEARGGSWLSFDGVRRPGTRYS
jgi:sugar fermentation stimulation protein A